MQCTLLIPHPFWSRDTADWVAQELQLPALHTLLARSRVDRYPPLGAEAWLCQAFEVERQHDWPVAPLTLALDGGEPDGAYWLRADPVHIKVSREGLHLVDSSLFEVSSDEAQALTSALNAHFADAGITFFALAPKRWYVKRAAPAALVTRPIGEAAGKDVQRYLPSGGAALEWHGHFNEAQMLLHAHPVNEEREERGEPPVNSVWFWGGGLMPAVRGSPFASVASDDTFATALAAAADVPAAPLPADARAWLEGRHEFRASSLSHLITLDQLAGAVLYQDTGAWRSRMTGLEKQWFAPLLSALREGRVAQLSLVILGAQASCRYTVKRTDLLKLWRRVKPLSAYA